MYRELGQSAWSWVLGQIREADGPWLPDVVTDDGHAVEPPDDRDSLYAGIAGLAPVLAEIGQHRALTDTERSLTAGIVARLSRMASVRAEPSLYDGLAGDLTALTLLAPEHGHLALRRLVELSTPAGWETTIDLGRGASSPLTDLVMGTAGVVLAAAWAGGDGSVEIMTTGGEALLSVAETDRGRPRLADVAGLRRRAHRTSRTAPPESPPRWRSPGTHSTARTSSTRPARVCGTCSRSAHSTTTASSSRTRCRSRGARWNR